MRRRIWTHAEVILVANRYYREGPAHLSVELGRSESSVSSLARRFGLKTPRRPYRRGLDLRRNPTVQDDARAGYTRQSVE